jgi:hypothetical protein
MEEIEKVPLPEFITKLPELAEKSAALVVIWFMNQNKVVPLAIFAVVTVNVNDEPSFIEDEFDVILYVGLGGVGVVDVSFTVIFEDVAKTGSLILLFALKVILNT